MANVCSIILIFSSLEDEDERINQVNSFKLNNGKNLELKSLSSSFENDDLWVGGNKYMLGCIYMGAYDNIDENNFLKYINSSVEWEEKELVQILVKNENNNDLKYRLIVLQHN